VSSTTELFHGFTQASAQSERNCMLDTTGTVVFPKNPPRLSAGVADRLLPGKPLSGPIPARIAIKAKGRILLIESADVIAVEARGNYVLLLRSSISHLLRESISTMQEKLTPYGFVRIHRSALVNAALVEEIQPWPTGEYVLRVKGGREYTVTRTYKKNLQQLAQSWIGLDGFAAE
jgi:DNA-binding LytR/AlgR family response regulator